MSKQKLALLVSILAAPLAVAVIIAAILFIAIDRGGIGRKPIQFSTTAKNKFPIVIHHGFLPVTGLHKFARHLQREGFNAYSTQVSAANSIAFRARQLAEQIDQVLKESGSAKVNIIAHSMGGLDSRYLISSLGYQDKIASLSTISTPHLGSRLCDYLVMTDRKLLGFILNLVGVMTVPGTNFDNVDSEVVGRNLSTSYMTKTFNPENPNSPGIYYQSWGASCEDVDGCSVTPFLMISHAYLHKVAGPNDGLVAVEETKWGEFHGDLKVDHFSQIDSRLIFQNTSFDAYHFFTKIASGLSNKGF
jgi:triacylglycerol lipase